MALIRTASTRYSTNSSFGETINKFQDWKKTPKNKDS